MAGARVFGAPPRANRLEGTRAASRRRSGSGHHAERGRSARLTPARQARHCRHHPQLAGLRLQAGRSETRVRSSISRQLIFWLAVPLMLVELCGALVHYFNSVAPGAMSSAPRLKETRSAGMRRVQGADRRLTLAANAN